MKLYTFVVHYLQMFMKEYGCCPKFKRRDTSTYAFTKKRGMSLVSATLPKRLIRFIWNFTVLQLCKVSQKSNKPFRRSCAYNVHNAHFCESISWIISPFKSWTATIFLHAYLQVVYYKCVKFHINLISRLGRVALTRDMPLFFVKA
jgi:hypothetical protein